MGQELLNIVGICIYMHAFYRECELHVQEARQTARAERIAAIRAGTSKSARTTELKSSAKAFVCQMRADSDYTGEDYEVFAKWLSQGHGDEKGEE
jgi:hypothetical protein